MRSPAVQIASQTSRAGSGAALGRARSDRPSRPRCGRSPGRRSGRPARTGWRGRGCARDRGRTSASPSTTRPLGEPDRERGRRRLHRVHHVVARDARRSSRARPRAGRARGPWSRRGPSSSRRAGSVARPPSASASRIAGWSGSIEHNQDGRSRRGASTSTRGSSAFSTSQPSGSRDPRDARLHLGELVDGPDAVEVRGGRRRRSSRPPRRCGARRSRGARSRRGPSRAPRRPAAARARGRRPGTPSSRPPRRARRRPR